MQKLKKNLKNRLADAKKIAILGVGSELRGDDAAGIVIGKELKAYIQKKRIKSTKAFLGHTAPENLTGEIKKFKPTHLIIIDAVELQEKAGTARIIDIDKETGPSFSTHKIPIRIIRDYLDRAIGCETIIIGIQPQSWDLSFSLSPRVRKAATIVLKELTETLKEINRN